VQERLGHFSLCVFVRSFVRSPRLLLHRRSREEAPPTLPRPPPRPEDGVEKSRIMIVLIEKGAAGLHRPRRTRPAVPDLVLQGVP
jgi:hypothetical protein